MSKQHPRYKHGAPLNYAARKAELRKTYINEKNMEKFRDERRSKFQSSFDSIPERFRFSIPYAMLQSDHDRYKFSPYSTSFIGKLATQIYLQHVDFFMKAKVSLIQLFLLSLKQLHNHVASVSDESIPSVFIPKGFDEPIHEINFRPLIEGIKSFRIFELHGVTYHPVIVPSTELNHHYLTYDRLPEVLKWLSSSDLRDREARESYLLSGVLPGVEFDSQTFTITNIDAFSVPFPSEDCMANLVDAVKGEISPSLQTPNHSLFFVFTRLEFSDWLNGRDGRLITDRPVDAFGILMSLRELASMGVLYEWNRIHFLTVRPEFLMGTTLTSHIFDGGTPPVG